MMALQHVYVNEVTKEVQFVYFPTIVGNISGNLIDFIESIVYSIQPADEKDNEFAFRFIYYFKSIKPFDILEVEKFVLKEDRSVVNTIRKQNAGQSGFMTDKQQHYFEHYDDNSDDKTALLIEEDEATGLLEDEATGLLVEDNEETGLLNEANVNIRYPSLFRILTNETIMINKPVFRIGKERSYVDYFVTNNIAVSRSHADIITRGNNKFVKDLNSKNHTYINGKEIPVHTEIELNDGDELKLGNEEFVFHKTNSMQGV